jgi:hypothetical protein
MSQEYVVDLDIPEVNTLALQMRQSWIEYARLNNQPIVIQKHLVDRFGGLKVEIFSDEHAPPHFRVKFQSSAANYRISDCKHINGSGEILRHEKCIVEWWETNKQNLINCWNVSRPSDCPVGLYQEGAA